MGASSRASYMGCRDEVFEPRRIGLRLRLMLPDLESDFMQTSVLTTFPAAGLLRQRELVSGGWSYLGSSQPALQATALPVMALSGPGREKASRSQSHELP